MSNKNILTPMQLQAINHLGGNALVSASAGSGKTFVVIERIIKLILENGVNVDEILAVTFTKLAAEEMKEKLNSALTKKYLATRDIRLKQQLDLIPSADVSTIHSFCSKLIKEYFYELKIDANCQVVEESKKKRLEESAIDKLFEELYDLGDKNFLKLCSIYCSNRSDTALKNLVKSLYEHCISEGGIDCVYNQTENTYVNAIELLIDSFKDEIKSLCDDKILSFNRLIGEFSDDDLRKNYCNNVIGFLKELQESTDYFEFFTKSDGLLPLPTTKSKNPEAQKELKSEIEDLRKKLKEPILVFSSSKEREEIKLKNSFEIVKILFDLVKSYQKYYVEIKKEENALDFNDLENLALELLQNQEILQRIKSKYKYIFVDEYQDVNLAQEKIVSLISNENAFLVGDLKQSIYAFRGCNPTYFENKYQNYLKGDGTAISLDYNFRSANAIITTVNEIFSKIMKRDFGGTDYFLNPMIYGGGYNEFEGESVIHVINKVEKEEEPVILRGVYSVKNTTEKTGDKSLSEEVKLILKLISDNLGKPYYDVKEKDPAKRYKKTEFKDIAILLRSLGSQRLAEELVSSLTELSIPVSSSVKKSIKDYPEIKVMLNIVSLLCCADRDVPLASVMLNLFNFTENELCLLRKNYQQSKHDSFYACVKNACNYSDSLSEKVKNFISWLNDKRIMAEFMPADKLLGDIISETGYLAKITASTFGAIKVKRIERFIGESVTSGKQIKIKEFESRLDDVIEDLTVSETSGDNTVKIMTMHASKGLEFPVVILAGTSRKFNSSDRFGNFITLRGYGVGLKSYFEDTYTYTENATRNFIKHKLKKDCEIEELRLFYVALTRAKCALHVIVDKKDVNLNAGEYNSMSDFISVDKTPVVYYNGVDFDKDSIIGTSVAGGIFKSDLTSDILSSLSYSYPYKNEIDIPVKSSVSEVNSHEQEEFFETTKLFGESSIEKGNAYHRFFELIDFNKYRGEEDAKRFVDSALMTEEEIAEIDFDKVDRILNLDLFKRLKTAKLYKERKFCYLVPANELFETTSRREVLVQGVIDLMAVTENEAIIIDYKISTIDKDEDLVKKYKKQVELYKNAVQKALQIKVEKCYIVNVLKESIIQV